MIKFAIIIIRKLDGRYICSRCQSGTEKVENQWCIGRCFRKGGHQSHVSLWLKSVHEITQYYGGLQPLEPPPPSYDTENNRLQVYLCMATHSKQPVW